MNIVFPHTLNGEQVKLKKETEIVRKENLISFSLPIKVNIKNNLKSRRKINSNYIYVLEFQNINEALVFCKNPEIEVIPESEKDVYVLESEMNKLMEEYEKREKNLKIKK
ncbi:hypothetical protein DMUE_2880 [Dictyocoela muelleri]|nr:hypothetical protein DMUE_2880 [Dictyocoela muelleri]